MEPTAKWYHTDECITQRSPKVEIKKTRINHQIS